MTGALEAASKWVGKTKNYSTGIKKWVGKRPFSIKIKQKSGWARAHPAHPAPTPLLLIKNIFGKDSILRKNARLSLEKWRLLRN